LPVGGGVVGVAGGGSGAVDGGSPPGGGTLSGGDCLSGGGGGTDDRPEDSTLGTRDVVAGGRVDADSLGVALPFGSGPLRDGGGLALDVGSLGRVLSGGGWV
jgi:hypothetical protein